MSIFNSVFLGGIFISFFNSCSSFISLLPLFIFKLFNIGYFIIKNDDKKVNEIIKILEKTTISSITLYEFGKIKPNGIFISYQYIGRYIDIPSDYQFKKELHILTFEKIFKNLIKDNDDNENTNTKLLTTEIIKNNKKITIYERAGTYHRLYYDKRIFDISTYFPTKNQSTIINSIKTLYTQKKNASIFISGEPGSGKSMIGFLLAKELNGKLVRTFNPCEPGDSMIAMVREVEPTFDNPLILMIDEANILIKKIVENKIIQHKNIPIMVYDKITFNRFMDDMMFYDNVILILTSNESKDIIDSFDISFLRSGRIDKNFVL